MIIIFHCAAQVRGTLVTLPLSRLSAPLESRLVNLLCETPAQVNNNNISLKIFIQVLIFHYVLQAIPVEKVEEVYLAAHGSNFRRLLEVSNNPNIQISNYSWIDPSIQLS